MAEITEIVWYKNFDWSMIWVCVMAVFVHALYLEVSNNNGSLKVTWKHYLFYLLSSLLVLTFISEVGLKFVNYFFTIPVDLIGTVDHLLAALSGLGGSYIVTIIINRFKKK